MNDAVFATILHVMFFSKFARWCWYMLKPAVHVEASLMTENMTLGKWNRITNKITCLEVMGGQKI